MMALTRLKMAALAPMPSASVRQAVGDVPIDELVEMEPRLLLELPFGSRRKQRAAQPPEHAHVVPR